MAMNQLQPGRSFRNALDTSSDESNSEMDGIDERMDSPKNGTHHITPKCEENLQGSSKNKHDNRLNSSRKDTFHVTSEWIERQGKLLDLGLRLSSNNKHDDVIEALQELQELLEGGLRGTIPQSEHISVDIPEVGRAWYMEGQIRHCEEDDMGLHYQVLQDGEFTIFDDTIVFLSKHRKAIVGAKLPPSSVSTNNTDPELSDSK